MEFNMSFPKEFNNVKENRIPFVICGGTVEYHGPHCSYGCDTLIAEGLSPLTLLENAISALRSTFPFTSKFKKLLILLNPFGIISR